MQINIGRNSNKLISIGILIIYLIISCKPSTRIPSNVLGINKMKKILWDMVQVDQFTIQYISRDSSKNSKQETAILYQKVLSLHQITSNEFKHSLYYYIKHPFQQKILLDSLSQYATRMKTKNYRFENMEKLKN